MRLKSLIIRVAAFLGLSALSPAVLAGPSDHSFAWTAGASGSAELWLDGTDMFTATNRGWIAQNGTNNFGDDSFVSKLVLLTDASSDIPGFETHAQNFMSEMTGRGMQTSTTTEYLA